MNFSEAFGVSHLAMEKLEPAEETILIQGKYLVSLAHLASYDFNS